MNLVFWPHFWSKFYWLPFTPRSGRHSSPSILFIRIYFVIFYNYLDMRTRKHEARNMYQKGRIPVPPVLEINHYINHFFFFRSTWYTNYFSKLWPGNKKMSTWHLRVFRFLSNILIIYSHIFMLPTHMLSDSTPLDELIFFTWTILSWPFICH